MINVGYVPYSQDLKHPADRRRLAAWAKYKGVELNLANPLESDVLILSNAANFGYWIKRAKQPVILDLVDSYLGGHPNFFKDVARNIIRSFRGTSKLRWIMYTNHVRAACKTSHAVIVASIEQKDAVYEFNQNVHVILDDHSELDAARFARTDNLSHPKTLERPGYIFWEGFGYTLKHFQSIAKELDQFLFDRGWGMFLLTTREFPRWGGYIGNVKTEELIRKWFPKAFGSIEIVPWSVENVISYANRSCVAVIPIISADKFAALKSENKLLSMWHLGLPTLFSSIPSYSRVAIDAQQEDASIKEGFWLASLLNFANMPEMGINLRQKGEAYINEHHTHQKLMYAWDAVIKNIVEY